MLKYLIKAQVYKTPAYFLQAKVFSFYVDLGVFRFFPPRLARILSVFATKKKYKPRFLNKCGKTSEGPLFANQGAHYSKELCVLVPTACDEIICQAWNCMHNVALMGLNMVEL